MTLAPPRLYPLHGVLALVLVLALLALLGPVRRGLARAGATARRDLGLVALLGVGVRLGLSPWGWTPVPDLGWTRLVMALTGAEPHPLNGAGIPVLLGGPAALAGGGVDAVLATTLAWSCLAPPLGWALGWQLAGRVRVPRARVRVARAAGVLLALYPTHVLFSAGVSEHAVLATLCLLATTAALGRGWICALLAAATAGLAAHVRPEVLPWAGLLGLALLGAPAAWPGRLVAGGLLAGLGAWRVAALHGLDTARRVLGPERLLDLGRWWDLLVGSMDPAVDPRLGVLPLADPRLSPALLYPLAVVGLGLALFGGRRRLVPLAWLALFLPVAMRGPPLSDQMRFFLPSDLLAVAAAGLGIRWVGRRLPRLRAWMLPLVVLLGAVPLARASRPWMAQRALAFMRAQVPTVPADAPLLVPQVDNYSDREAILVALLAGRGVERRGRRAGGGPVAPETVVRLLAPGQAPPEGPFWAWLPVQCTASVVGANLAPQRDLSACETLARCRATPRAVAHLDGRVDSWWSVPEGGVPVGLVEVTACPEGAVRVPRPAPVRAEDPDGPPGRR